jgi:hypothetical protein
MPSKDTYYRNRIPINNIEQDTLWVLRCGLKVTLVDSDQHLEMPLDARFYEVPEPPGLHPEEQE